LPADAASLQLRPLADTAPTDGQAVVWDDANNTWKPGTVDRFTRGEWSVLTTYVAGDVVSYMSQLYLSLAENTGYFPPSPTNVYWTSLNGNAIFLQSYAVSNVPPPDKQVLVFSQASNSWGSSIDVIGKINEIISWINSNGGSITPL
jgi:hypothetical protein